MRRWIQLILRSKNGLSMPGESTINSNNTNKLNQIPVPDINLTSIPTNIPQDTLNTLNSLQTGLKHVSTNILNKNFSQSKEFVKNELQLYITKLNSNNNLK